MQRFLDWIGALKTVLVRVTELGFALIGLIVLVYLLLGEESGAFVIGVMTNVLLLVGAFPPEALVAFALAMAIFYLVRRHSGRD